MVELMNHAAFVQGHVLRVWNNRHLMLVTGSAAQQKSSDGLHPLPPAPFAPLIVERPH
jgi:hypothetical protein